LRLGKAALEGIRRRKPILKNRLALAEKGAVSQYQPADTDEELWLTDKAFTFTYEIMTLPLLVY